MGMSPSCQHAAGGCEVGSLMVFGAGASRDVLANLLLFALGHTDNMLTQFRRLLRRSAGRADE